LRGIWKYADWMENIHVENQISLGEGGTPLLKSKNIGVMLGLEKLYFKLENLNPTGSYKDRFAAMAISNALEYNKKSILATSSGNTGAALAAFAAAANLPCKIIIVDGAPFGKLQQMGIYGAELYMVRDFGITASCTTDVMEYLRKLASMEAMSLEISAYCYSPIGMQGVQTIAFEIAEEQPEIRHCFVPAGGGGLFHSIQLGYETYEKMNVGFESPLLHVVQPKGNDTIASALKDKRLNIQPLAKCTSSISGLQVPSLLDAEAIMNHNSSANASGVLVEDDDVYKYQRMLAMKEGIFCEPAGAVALAGLAQAIKEKTIGKDEPIVCLITGNGPKDIKSLDRIYKTEDCAYIMDMKDLQDNITKNKK